MLSLCDTGSIEVDGRIWINQQQATSGFWNPNDSKSQSSMILTELYILGHFSINQSRSTNGLSSHSNSIPMAHLKIMGQSSSFFLCCLFGIQVITIQSQLLRWLRRNADLIGRWWGHRFVNVAVNHKPQHPLPTFYDFSHYKDYIIIKLWHRLSSESKSRGN